MVAVGLRKEAAPADTPHRTEIRGLHASAIRDEFRRHWRDHVHGRTNGARERSVMVSQESGGVNVHVRLQHTNFYLDEPSASVPAEPLSAASTLLASRFAVRAWTEAETIRVVVYAVIPDPRNTARSLETPISTFPLARVGATQVVDAAQWGARPVIVRAVRRVGG